jgi:crossover junction endodeoxyribonuclease RuvC
MRVLGIDPGLERTGWGVIEAEGNRLSFVAGGTIITKRADEGAQRLKDIFDGLTSIVQHYKPHHAAVEEVFVNNNARSSLKLGQARGIALLVPSLHDIDVAEYSATTVKKSVVGTGRAEKAQVGHMVKVLLPRADVKGEDAADALAVAICHAHTLQSSITKKIAGMR